jgi:hypothetical protein
MNFTAPFRPLLRGLLVALGGIVLLVRRAPAPAAPPPEPEPAPALPREPWLSYLRAVVEPEPPVAPAPRRTARRAAMTVALTAIFCLGAAFTAVAGDRGATLLDDPATATDTTPTTTGPADDGSAAGETTPTDPAGDTGDVDPPPPATDSGATAPPPPAPEEDDAVSRHEHVLPTPAAAPATPMSTAAPVARRRTQAHRTPAQRTPPPLIRPIHIPKRANGLDVESSLPGATVWLHRVLPDPTPPSRRLTSRFADDLKTSAQRAHVDWALLLGVLRAQGETGAEPANRARLDELAHTLAQAGAPGQPWAAALAATGDSVTADNAVAIAHLDRGVGLAALVHGLEWAKERLGARLLRDPRVTIYEGGRADIAAGRIDVRVLALIGYLTEEFGSIDVSCLLNGHRLYARPGVVSAHIYGLAVDVAALGGTPILGNQEPGGITERAVRSILLLPAELRPRQVISLLGLGGPSFPLADHADHIHVGY